MAETVSGRDRKLFDVIQSRVEEPPYPAQYVIGGEGVPITDRAPRACPGVLIESCQAEGVGNHSRSRNVRPGQFAVRDLSRVGRLAVQEEFGVEFSWPPTFEHFARH